MSVSAVQISDEEWALVRAANKFRGAKQLLAEGITLVPASYTDLVPDEARATVHNALDRWIRDLADAADACP